MTYRQLLVQLKRMSDEQLDMTVTYFNADEEQYYGVDLLPANQADAEDILGQAPGIVHPILMIAPGPTVKSNRRRLVRFFDGRIVDQHGDSIGQKDEYPRRKKCLE